MAQEKILLCGLPESGKTTFLAALWYLLYEKEIPTELTLGAFPQYRDYLNRLSGKWSRFNPIDRTATDEIREIRLQLVDGSSGGEVELRVPDMSGETWESVWSSRFCAAHVAEWAVDAAGIMLFLHADNIRQSIDIATRDAMTGPIEEEGDEPIVKPWSPSDAPTQVVLVDILQALTYPPLGSKRRHLAVIVSAWDKAANASVAPGEYIKTHLPLFYQYIFHSGAFTGVRIFGVSAQGGDLTSQEEAKRLKAEELPSNRILVVDRNGDRHHDLTVPIRWLVAR